MNIRLYNFKGFNKDLNGALNFADKQAKEQFFNTFGTSVDPNLNVSFLKNIWALENEITIYNEGRTPPFYNYMRIKQDDFSHYYFITDFLDLGRNQIKYKIVKDTITTFVLNENYFDILNKKQIILREHRDRFLRDGTPIYDKVLEDIDATPKLLSLSDEVEVKTNRLALKAFGGKIVNNKAQSDQLFYYEVYGDRDNNVTVDINEMNFSFPNGWGFKHWKNTFGSDNARVILKWVNNVDETIIEVKPANKQYRFNKNIGGAVLLIEDATDITTLLTITSGTQATLGSNRLILLGEGTLRLYVDNTRATYVEILSDLGPDVEDAFSLPEVFAIFDTRQTTSSPNALESLDLTKSENMKVVEVNNDFIFNESILTRGQNKGIIIPINKEIDIKTEALSLDKINYGYTRPSKNLAMPDLTGKEYLGDGWYRIINQGWGGVDVDYNVYQGYIRLNGESTEAGWGMSFFDTNNTTHIDNVYTYSVRRISGAGVGGSGLNDFTIYTSNGNSTLSISKTDEYATKTNIKNNNDNRNIALSSVSSSEHIGRVYDNVVFQVQIEKGDTATDYEVPGIPVYKIDDLKHPLNNPKLFTSQFNPYILSYYGEALNLRRESFIDSVNQDFNVQVSLDKQNFSRSLLKVNTNYEEREINELQKIIDLDNEVATVKSDFNEYLEKYDENERRLREMQIAKAQRNIQTTAVVSGMGIAVGVAASIMSANPLAMAGTITATAGAVINLQNQVKNLNDLKEELNISYENKIAKLQSTVAKIAGGGANLNNISGNNKIRLYKFDLQPEDLEYIDNFLHRFGYNTLAYKYFNHESRSLWNYLKMEIVESTINSIFVTDEIIKNIKERFRDGVTIFHNVTIGGVNGFSFNFAYENWERNLLT